jgi:carbon-monoxide dehydrogenase large subunit
MAKFGIGSPCGRVEDQRLITGRAATATTSTVPDQVFGYVLRSPTPTPASPCGLTRREGGPGVLAVLTAEDLGDAEIPCKIPMKNRDGSDRADPSTRLCRDEVNYVGDNVAFVVAETRLQAKDAAELIDVRYEPLPAVADTAKAIEPGQPTCILRHRATSPSTGTTATPPRWTRRSPAPPT